MVEKAAMLEEDIFNGVDDDASNSGRVGVSEIIGGGANVGYGRGGEDLFLENDISNSYFQQGKNTTKTVKKGRKKKTEKGRLI